MASEPNSYRRLPGQGSGAFETARLYLGTDHLLQVSSSGFTESYRRFYFRDIQAITLRASIHGKIWNAAWGFFIFFSVVIALQVSDIAIVIWLGIAAISLLLIGINVARGPTCVCQIQTAVQTRPLPSLNRLRRAGKIMAQIKPLIEAAQGPLAPDEFVRKLDESRRGPTAGFAAPESASPPAESALPPPA